MKRFKKAAVLTLAIVLLVLGVAGLVLPFLQGILFIAAGLILLSLYSPRIRAFLAQHRIRFPKLDMLLTRAEAWLRRIIGEV